MLKGKRIERGGEGGEEKRGEVVERGEEKRRSVLKYSSDSTCTRIQMRYRIQIAGWNSAKLRRFEASDSFL